MRLTDTAIKNAKPREKDYKLFDGYGLHVLVTRSGSKLWRMKYRYRGREKLLSFGPYPLVTLKHAREKRDDARLMLLEDRDPSEEKKRARIDTIVSWRKSLVKQLSPEAALLSELIWAPGEGKETHWGFELIIPPIPKDIATLA